VYGAEKAPSVDEVLLWAATAAEQAQRLGDWEETQFVGNRYFRWQFDALADQYDDVEGTFVSTSDWKRVARVFVYRRAAELCGARYRYSDSGEVLILPGGDPSAEVACAKRYFPKCRVVAFDASDECCHRALQAGADEVIIGDLANVNSWRAEECIRGRDFRFVNLDLCGNLNAYVEKGIHSIGLRAGLLAVWASYGHENKDEMSAFTSTLQDNKICLGDEGWKQNGLDALNELPETVQGRLLWMCRVLGYRRYLDAVVTYRGNRMPMLVAMLPSVVSVPDESRTKVQRLRGDARSTMLQIAESEGLDQAAAMLGVERNRLIAWKAVATRTARAAQHVEKQLPVEVT